MGTSTRSGVGCIVPLSVRPQKQVFMIVIKQLVLGHVRRTTEGQVGMSIDC